MKRITRFCPSAAFLLLIALGGCRAKPVVAQSEIAPTADSEVATAPIPAPLPTRRVAPPKGAGHPSSATLLDPSAFRADPSRRRDGFASHGFVLTPEQYQAGYDQFLEGRAPSQTLENQYRLILEERLLVLSWVNSPAGPGPGQPPGDASGQMLLLGMLADTVLERWPDGRPIAEADLQALYELRGDRYRRPERAHVRMILVPTAEDADSIRKRLDEGESFGQLAAIESRHESRSRFGELDPFPRGTYEPAFEDLAFRLAPGDVQSLETPSGVFILQKVATIAPVQTPYAEVRGELLRELKSDLREATSEEIRKGVKDPL